ncbi:MAG TPA: prephenate dehydrogenase [Arcobacter sp.]|nr:prephenate dehydrogenase [Arcobacter sp.]HIP56206.1 prephenate dehydrogenase [Arcobacter sp.]
MNLGIVGLGLMGGSFGKAMRKYNLAEKIFGYDHNLNHQKDAISLNLVDKIVDIEELKLCDMIVLCIPVDAIISFLPFLEECASTTTIIDFGSTKKLIVENIPLKIKNNFIPAHPMTGTEKFGPNAAIDGLYENKTIVLCDLDKCDHLHKNRAISIFKKLNMKLVFMDSTEHDVHACYMSHLPHAISFALGNIVMNHENPNEIISLAAGGFKDMSRIAKSSPDMWTDIFRQNKDNMLESIDLYEKQITLIKNMIKDEKYDDMKKWMAKANTLHDIL